MRRKIMVSLGLSGPTTRGIVGEFAGSLTATGSNQAGALALTADVNVVTSTPSSTGVLLPGDLGSCETITVVNQGGATLLVYPATSGGKVQNGSAGAGYSLGNNLEATFRNIGGDNWSVTKSA